MQPETLGRYRIVKELGRGAMGCVFLAHDPSIDRKVAIKTIQIFSGLPEDERGEARERFLQEARSAGKLSHPGIVTVFDVGEQDGVPYLAMEYVEGTTLDAFCRAENLLPVKTVVELVAGAAAALDYAHRSRIVHRDIKPANLMRVGETRVKVMDFGLARGAEAQASQEQALFGTPSFMSPEQIRGQELDGRSDLFSLAAVLYQLLTGEKAFAGDSVSSIIYRVVNETPRDARHVSARIPAPLAAFLDRALAKERDARYPSGEAFAAALRAAAGVAGEAPAEIAPAPEEAAAPAPSLEAPVAPGSVSQESLPAARRRRRRRPKRSFSALPWLLAVAILGGGGAAGWIYRDQVLGFLSPGPREVWLEVQVRTDPPGLPLTLDGEPFEAGSLRYLAQEPFGILAVTEGCRTTEHTLSPEDAGGELVLVPDPTDVEVIVDAGVEGADVRLNDASAGTAPATVALDLCRENSLVVRADGYREERIVLAAGATPLEVRNALGALRLQEIPKGWIELSGASMRLRYYLDGNEVARTSEPLEVLEGTHKLRLVNRDLWIDVTQSVEVRGGETARPELKLPGVATMVVQAFPANCKVYLRRRGASKWRYVDDTPMRRDIAAGRYEVKVQLKRTGDERVQEVRLRPGDNPPVRVSFGNVG
jgi:predicted Ser/Thr protein kinase